MDVQVTQTECGVSIAGAAWVVLLVPIYYANSAGAFELAPVNVVTRGRVVEWHASTDDAQSFDVLPATCGLAGSGGRIDQHFLVIPDEEWGLVQLRIDGPGLPLFPDGNPVVQWPPIAWADAALVTPAMVLADFNGDGFVNADDIDTFIMLFDAGSPAADFNCDGFVNGADFDAFAEVMP